MKLIVNGHPAYAYTGGKTFDPALPCVVFVHGALNDHSVWTLLARWYAHHGWSVLAVDLPGHGRSGGAPLASVEAMAAWLHALLDAAGVRQAALVGHSMGSLVALEAAGRASALVLVGTAYPMKVSEALLATARDAPETAMAMVNAFSHSLASAKPGYPGPGAWLRGGALALMRRLQSRQTGLNLFENDFQVCNRYAGGEAAAARVGCPVSLLLGRLDQMTPPKAASALAAMFGAAGVHMLDCGHDLMGEDPEGTLRVLRKLLPAR